MVAELLVEPQIDDGQRLIEQLVRDHFEVAVALWVKEREEGSWHLFVASPQVDAMRPGESYPALFASLTKLPFTTIQVSDIRLVNDANPIARDAMAVRDRYPARIATRYRGKRLGDLSIEEAYIYPPLPEDFPGFNETKRRFPSAQVFALTIPLRDRNLMGWLFPVTAPLLGKINNSEFEGREAGTLRFEGPRASGDLPVGKLVFFHRPEGWNRMFRADTQTWEEVVQLETGKRLYEGADFSPLAALKSPS